MTAALTGRGKPLLRGVVPGLMTTAGGIGHTLPYLIPAFQTATALAVAVVAVELLLTQLDPETDIWTRRFSRCISSDRRRSVGVSRRDFDRQL